MREGVGDLVGFARQHRDSQPRSALLAQLRRPPDERSPRRHNQCKARLVLPPAALGVVKGAPRTPRGSWALAVPHRPMLFRGGSGRPTGGIRADDDACGMPLRLAAAPPAP